MSWLHALSTALLVFGAICLALAVCVVGAIGWVLLKARLASRRERAAAAPSPGAEAAAPSAEANEGIARAVPRGGRSLDEGLWLRIGDPQSWARVDEPWLGDTPPTHPRAPLCPQCRRARVTGLHGGETCVEYFGPSGANGIIYVDARLLCPSCKACFDVRIVR